MAHLGTVGQMKCMRRAQRARTFILMLRLHCKKNKTPQIMEINCFTGSKWNYNKQTQLSLSVYYNNTWCTSCIAVRL